MMPLSPYIFPVPAYLLGSIPFGLVLTRLFTAKDIRRRGSGNIGATNVSRIAGWKLGILTLLGDMLKGALPVYLALKFANVSPAFSETFASLIAIAAFAGHLYPAYMKFQGGGKGVATAAGCFLVLSPAACLISLSAFILLTLASRRVSVGSLTAAGILPAATWGITHSWVLTACALVFAGLIFFRHRDNIRRLTSGTEPEI